MSVIETYAKRQSVYALTDTCPIPDDEIVKLVRDVMAVVPSAFNSQPVRAFVLLGDAHRKLWAICREALRVRVPADKFAPVAAKMDMFAAGRGSILFLTVDAVTADLQKNFPAYAANFPVWADQAQGIAQFAVWTALRERGVGANLQHYSPLIDAGAAQAFGLPASWRLVAQMVFGGIRELPPANPRLPGDETVRVVRR